MQHPYCYPGTDVYRNKLDIRDHEALDRFERRASSTRAEFLPADIPLTQAGFRYLHAYMLQDVYDWAGQYRYVDTGRTGPFCKAQFIKKYMGEQFAALKAENNLRGLDAGTFAERAAEHCSELNRIHPFLDGNGRTLRAFLQRLGEQAGHPIDLTRIEADAWNQASVVSFHQFDTQPLAAIIAGTMTAPGHSQNVAPRRDPEPPTQSIDDDFGL